MEIHYVYMKIKIPSKADKSALDPHRHQNVAVLVLGFGVFGAELAGGLRVLELQPDLAFVAARLQKLKNVRGIEADHDGVAGVRRLNRILALAGIGRVGAELQLIGLELHADRARAFVGKLRHALDRGAQLTGADNGELGVVARHHGFKVRELAGELARAQGTRANAEEERVLVVGKLDGLGVGIVEQLLQLLQGLARNQHALFATDAGQGLVDLFDKGQAVTVGGDHGQRLGLQNQQRAVERIARLFARDGEDGVADQCLERVDRNGGRGDRREIRHLRIVGAGHADDLGVRAATANLHPVVVEQLDREVAIGQQLDVVIELACRDGAGTGRLDLDRRAGPDRLVQIGGRDRQQVVIGLDEKVRQNRDGGLALNHALRCGQLF